MLKIQRKRCHFNSLELGSFAPFLVLKNGMSCVDINGVTTKLASDSLTHKAEG